MALSVGPAVGARNLPDWTYSSRISAPLTNSVAILSPAKGYEAGNWMAEIRSFIASSLFDSSVDLELIDMGNTLQSVICPRRRGFVAKTVYCALEVFERMNPPCWGGYIGLKSGIQGAKV